MLAPADHRIAPVALACDEVHAALAALNPARLPAARDPLDIALPALTGTQTLNRDTLQLIGALYWQSEIQHTGMLLAAEMLADARFELGQLPASSMARLDTLAQRMRGRWVTRAQREALFARLFGDGAGASTQASAAVNHEFARLFANVCAAIASLCQPAAAAYGGPDEGRLRLGIAGLLDNLAGRNVAAASTVAITVGEQVRAAIGILQDAGVLAMLGATNPWQALARLFGDQAPDFGRYLSRAQAGRQVIAALAALPQLGGQARIVPATLPCQEAYVWLDASGLAASLPRAAP